MSLRIKDAESLHNLNDGALEVHSVEVEEPMAVLDEIAALQNSELDTVLSHFFIISLDGLECLDNFRRDLSLAELDRSI